MTEKKQIVAPTNADNNPRLIAASTLAAAIVGNEQIMENIYFQVGQHGDMYELIVEYAIHFLEKLEQKL